MTQWTGNDARRFTRHLKATSCIVKHDDVALVAKRRSDKIDPRGTLDHSIDFANESRTVNILWKRRPLGQRRVKLDADVAQLILERNQLWSGGVAEEDDALVRVDIVDLREPAPGVAISVAAVRNGFKAVDYQGAESELKGIQLAICGHW